jgi:hypothetical protein
VKYHIDEYDYIVPIGSNCRIGQALNDLGYRKLSLPLDWTLTSCAAVYKAFEKDFSNFMSHDTCVLQDINNYPHVLNTKFNVNITHDKAINKESIEKYNRRSERLLRMLNSDKKVLFIRHHNDGEYMINDIIHSDYNHRELKDGHDPLDLSYLYKLHDLISQKYPALIYDIVLFHYKDINTKNDNRIKFFRAKSDESLSGRIKAPDHIQCIELIKKLQG